MVLIEWYVHDAQGDAETILHFGFNALLLFAVNVVISQTIFHLFIFQARQQAAAGSCALIGNLRHHDQV